MNADTFKELPMSEKLDHLLMISQKMVERFARPGASSITLEAKDAATNSLWSERWDDQQRILDILQEHSAKMDHIAAHL